MTTRAEPSAGARPAYLDESGPFALFMRLHRIGLHLERIQQECMEPFGIAFADYTVLALLRREGPPHRLPVTRIADLLLRSTGGITQLIDRLERRELVARCLDAADRRRVLVTLTPAGLDLAIEGLTAYDRVRQRVLDQLDADHLHRADASIRELLGVFEHDAR